MSDLQASYVDCMTYKETDMSDTVITFEEHIRKRAYELWEQAGKPEGLHEDFWHQATAEFTAHEGVTPISPENPRPRHTAAKTASLVKSASTTAKSQNRAGKLEVVRP